MRRALGAIVVAIVAPVACAACAAVFGFERLTDDSGDSATGEDASTDADAHPDATGGVCGDLGIVAQPADAGEAGDAGDAAPAELDFALHVVDFGIDTATGVPGFNLDKTCSPNVAASSCSTTVDEITFGKYAQDHGDHGLDNSGYGLLQYLGALGDAFKPSSVNARMQSGEFGAVVRITRWNGLPDDGDIFIEIFPAIGVWKPVDGGVPDAGGAKPTFTSQDQWMRDTRFQLAGGLDAASIKSQVAWVSGGKIGAFFQDLTLPISVPDDPKKLDIRVREVWLSADLSLDASGAHLANATIGGRWKTVDFFDQVRQIFLKDTLGVKNDYLCAAGVAQFAYNAVKKEACDGRDLRSASREDNAGLPCDSISVGLRFDPYVVDKPGPFAAAPTLPARCLVDAAVPVSDDCPAP